MTQQAHNQQSQKATLKKALTNLHYNGTNTGLNIDTAKQIYRFLSCSDIFDQNKIADIFNIEDWQARLIMDEYCDDTCEY